MNTTLSARHESAWSIIEKEKQRDQIIRRISFVAWTITAIVLLIFTVLIGIEVFQTLNRFEVGVGDINTVISTVMPLIAVVGFVSLLVATLSTVGVFLRLRTASLSEIQLRLSTLEEILLNQSDSKDRDQ
jgi:uncharacterized BrkB/YihY/UPF0761 family membrane protein